jgi:hypothetical protein
MAIPESFSPRFYLHLMRFLLACCFGLLTYTCGAQGRPQLTFDAMISAKLDTIHLAMNDLVKAFGTHPYRTSETRIKYQTDFRVGKAFVYLSEDASTQTMQIEFSKVYYEGSNAQFEQFYHDVVNKVTTILSATHDAQPEQKQIRGLQTIIYEKGKNVMDSHTSVFIIYSAFSEKFPTVSLYFYRKNK